MAEDKVRLVLVTPRRLLLTIEADMVVVPGGEGDFGVLAGHAPLLSTVRPGVVDIHQDDKVTRRIFIAGGFAEVSGERCAVLAEEAVDVSGIDPAAAEDRLAKANQALDESAEDSPQRGDAEREVKAAEAMLAATGTPAA